MLNASTRSVLSSLSSINNSMIISYPVTCVILGKNIQAFLDIEKLGEESFEEIGVDSITELNSIIGVVENPVIENKSGILTISNDSSILTFSTANIFVLEQKCRTSPDFINRVKLNEKFISFTLNHKEVEKIKKASSLLTNVTDLIISNIGNRISIKIASSEKSSNNYSIELPGEVIADASSSIVMQIFNKLPVSSYDVTLYRSKKGSMISVFKSLSVDGLEIVVSAKAC